ncbi:MAG: hypothetical protein GX639_19025 [Fibrobacter sp.]|nr:hypothetical protein [Fibrobacter sp.]
MKYPIRHIIFEITQACNLSCLYCYNYWRKDNSSAQQSTYYENFRNVEAIPFVTPTPLSFQLRVDKNRAREAIEILEAINF